MMAAKGLYYDPTVVRYTEPYMDDNDAKNHRRQVSDIPILKRMSRWLAATQGNQSPMGAEWMVRLPDGSQALEVEWLVKRAGLTPRGPSRLDPRSTQEGLDGGSSSDLSKRVSMPI